MSRWSVPRSPWWWDARSCTGTGHAGTDAVRALLVQLRYAAEDRSMRLWPADPVIPPPSVIDAMEGRCAR